MPTTMRCKTLEELQPIAKTILAKYSNERIFVFKGELGAGKTTLIKALCGQLKVIDPTNSPSFAIVNEYTTSEGRSLYHFDFYRLRNLAEVYDIGYEDYFYSGNYCFIEWPEIAAPILPPTYVEIEIDWDIFDGTRNISFTKKTTLD
ncbi:MAG: tRNA (adenosine(37)-N6)-threonylcarbamoyltransferase complex ATPase subunit type 1 TsaE [Bacteroidota bacterium]